MSDEVTVGSDFVPTVLAATAIAWIALLVVLLLGVAKGIGRVNLVLIPLLVLMFLAIVVIALTLPGAVDGLNAFFTPNWAALGDASVWVAGYGQIFLSLSVGFGIMITCSSCLRPKTDLTSSGLVVGLGSSSFEILAGIGVFAALGFMAALVPVMLLTAGFSALLPLRDHLDSVSSFELGRTWMVVVGGLIPIVLGYILIDTLTTTLAEGYGGMPTWFVNTFGWGTAAALVVIAYLLSRLPWPSATRGRELSPSPAILDAFTDRPRMRGDQHLSHWSHTALRTPALDQDFSYRTVEDGSEAAPAAPGRRAPEPVPTAAAAPWSTPSTPSRPEEARRRPRPPSLCSSSPCAPCGRLHRRRPAPAAQPRGARRRAGRRRGKLRPHHPTAGHRHGTGRAPGVARRRGPCPSRARDRRLQPRRTRGARAASSTSRATASQTKQKLTQRSTGICSPRTSTASRNCMIGATYWIMPTVLRGRRMAACPNRMSGTAVMTPAESSSSRCPVPSVPRVSRPPADSTATTHAASGVRAIVSTVSDTMAG